VSAGSKSQAAARWAIAKSQNPNFFSI